MKDKKAVMLMISPDQLEKIEDHKKQPRYEHFPMTVYILEMVMRAIEEDLKNGK